jgi:hypothetical protein
MAGADELMTGFYDAYQAVFAAVKKDLVYVAPVAEVPAVPAHDDIPEVPAVPAVPESGVQSLKTVILGEQFSIGNLPKAIINAEPAPIERLSMGNLLKVYVNFTVVVVIREYAPKDWFEDIIRVMGDVVDAILADRKLGGVVKDCYPVGFAPGEIKFQDKILYGGDILFRAELWYEP